MRKITHTSIELIADEGMLLTNGDRYCKAVFLPYDDDGANWKEVSESELAAEEDVIKKPC